MQWLRNKGHEVFIQISVEKLTVTFWRLQLDKAGPWCCLLDPLYRAEGLSGSPPCHALLWPLPVATSAPRGRHLAQRRRKTPGRDGETIKLWCVSLIVLSIKVLVVRPQQGSHPSPITRQWRADGTSTSSCGGLLKWLTTGYHLKYSIINAWVQLFPSLALEPVHCGKSI